MHTIITAVLLFTLTLCMLAHTLLSFVCCYQFGTVMNKAVTLQQLSPFCPCELYYLLLLFVCLQFYVLCLYVGMHTRVWLPQEARSIWFPLQTPPLGAGNWTQVLCRVSPGPGPACAVVTVPTELPSSSFLFPLQRIMFYLLFLRLQFLCSKFLYVCELRVKVHLFANKYTFDPAPFVEKIKCAHPLLRWPGTFVLPIAHICLASFEFVVYSLDFCVYP